MLVGNYFLRGDGSTQYSPTFPRGGLAASFRVQALQRIGTSASLTVTVEHKNREDTSFTTAGTFSALSGAAPQSRDLDVTSLKEEIRFSYVLTATNAYEGFLIYVFAPVWRPYP